jgi:ABC-type nitrate/sulfonate/bicarbonate transport system substrate-binding protein
LNSGLGSHTWLQEEFMLIKAKGNEELHEISVDLCSILNEQIWLPELNSTSLDLLRNRIQTLGLDIDDFKNRTHVPEKLMTELVQADGKMGICLCDQLPTKTHNKIRINELATPYRTYLHFNPKSNKTILSLIDKITDHNKMKSVKKTTIPILDRQIGLVAINNKNTEVIPVRVAMQSRTIQTVISGRAVQKLGLYESFLSEVNRIQKQIFTAEWKDYKSAAPILQDLAAGKLDIAIVGDYAVAHTANNRDTKDDVIVIGFVSINPYGSGSRLMIHKNLTNLGLTGLKDKTIHVPFLSTAHGSLLYNLRLKNILNQNNLVDLNLERKKSSATKILNPDGLACFTPFDHFFESEQGYQKSEDEVSMPFSYYAIVARKDFASSNPDAVTSFLKATLCSNYWFQTTPSSISYLSRWTGVNEAYVNQVLGERTENDCHYIPEINIRTDWIKEFSKKLFVTGEGKTTSAESDHPLINDDYLKTAKHQLGITT